MAITIIKQPANITAIVGTTAKFAVLVEGDVNGYNWQIKKPTDSGWAGTTMTGNKTPCLEIPAAVSRNGYMYRCLIWDTAGNQLITDEVTLTVIDVGFVNRSTMQGIADFIREKEESTETILPANMEPRLRALFEGLGSLNVMSGSATPSANTATLSLGATLPESDNYLFICTAQIFNAPSKYSMIDGTYTHYLRRVVIANEGGTVAGSIVKTSSATDAGGYAEVSGDSIGTLSGATVFVAADCHFYSAKKYEWWYAYA